MAPNFMSALKTYIVLPSSTCKAERSFSTVQRLKTYLCLTITQQCLNNLTILTTYRNEMKALDLNVVIPKFFVGLKSAKTSLECKFNSPSAFFFLTCTCCLFCVFISNGCWKKNLSNFLISNICFFCIDCLLYSLICN